MTTATATVSAPETTAPPTVRPEDVDAWIAEYQRGLLAKLGDKQLYDYQVERIKLSVLLMAPLYWRYVAELEMPLPPNASKAAKERKEERLHEVKNYAGRLLAWDMGTGKTAAAIVLAEALAHFFPRLFSDCGMRPLPCLIVCQATPLKTVWVPEIKQWTLRKPELDLLVIPTEEDLARPLLEGIIPILRPFFCVTTYDAVRCRSKLFHKMQWGVVISDEAHMHKNAATLRAKALFSVPTRFKVALGGTPSTNKPNDMWATLAHVQGHPIEVHHDDGHVSMIQRSDVWDTYEAFIDKYCEKGGRGGIQGGKNLTPQTCALCPSGRCCQCRRRFLPHTAKRRYCVDCRIPIPITCQRCKEPLNSRMKALVMDRLRSDEVQTLDPFRLQEVKHDLTTAQETVYDKLKHGYLEFMSNEGERGELNMANILAQWTYFLETCVDLRQIAYSIANHIGYKEGRSIMDFVTLTNVTANLRPEDFSGKLNRLREMLDDEMAIGQEDEDGVVNKVLIFTRFAFTARALARDLASYSPVVVDGDANQRKRDGTEQRVQRFLTNPDCSVFIGTSAAFDGLNLQAANKVVLYGHVDWSPMRINQAIKRAHRGGQKRTVWVYKMIAEGLIEDNLQSKWFNKQVDFDQALDGGQVQREGLWKSLSHSDIVRMV